MKNGAFSLIIVLFLILFNACTKNSGEEKTVQPAFLTGKWSYTAYYSSVGGAGEWVAVVPVNQWIDIKADGRFSSNLSPFSKATAYRLTDSIHIKFYDPGQPKDTLSYFYVLDKIKNELQLSPADPVCIEGCGQKFTK